jgi:hypothetical protein
MPDIATDGRVYQASRRPGQHEPGHHVGLEVGEFVRARRLPF